MNPRFNKLDHTLQFFRASLKNPLMIGAVLPSSKRLANAMVKNLTLSADDSVIEFGPGTGSLTDAIAKTLSNDSQYLGIELEEKFIFLLKQRFPELFFKHGSAENTQHYCDEMNMLSVKAIISALPFASLPKDVQMRIIHSIEKVLVKPGSMFRTFQYAHAYKFPNAINFRERMNHIFGPCHRSPLLVANVPPAYVLTWNR